MLRKLFARPPACLPRSLEIRDADDPGTLLLAEVDESAGNAGREGSDSISGHRNALHFVGAGELVLATAARHDLVGEASGGAERGTAVTVATPIDVTSVGASVAFSAVDTFTLAALPEAGTRSAAAGAGPRGS